MGCSLKSVARHAQGPAHKKLNIFIFSGVLYYLGCLAPPSNKALNLQHIFARAPREKSPLAPPISWAEGPAGGARGDFSRGALAKMCCSLRGLLLGGARQPRWQKALIYTTYLFGFWMPCGLGWAGSGAECFCNSGDFLGGMGPKIISKLGNRQARRFPNLLIISGGTY